MPAPPSDRWRRPRPHHYVVYGLYRVGSLLLWLLPFRALLALARGLGSLGWALDGRRRRIGEANVRQALPGADRREVRRLVRRSFQFVLETVLESLLLPRLARRPADEVRARISLQGFGKIEALKGSGRGVLMVTAHLGSFDFLGAAMGLFGFPCHIVMRPMKNPLLTREIERCRRVWGQVVLWRRGALRALVPALQAGANAAFAIDQNQRKRPIFLPVFGRLAACDRSVAALAVRLRLPVAVGYALRTGPGLRHTIVVEEGVHAGEEKDEVALARRIQGVLERMILRHPDSYFWVHDRYRTRPPEERAASARVPSEEEAPVGGAGR
jgi:Kdo2-lipid IVA lauroyltransferase/acyltransferase